MLSMNVTLTALFLFGEDDLLHCSVATGPGKKLFV